MKYEVRKKCMWGEFVIEPNENGSPDGVKVIDTADLVVNGKPLAGDIVQLFIRRKCLVPLAPDTPPEAKKVEKPKEPKKGEKSQESPA